MTTIYALCEPGTRTVRYIGATLNPKRRLRQHRSDSTKQDNLLGTWLRSLNGQDPNLVVLCETTEALGPEEETRYIQAARALGMLLVNSSDGGKGPGINVLPEIIDKRHQASSTPEHKAGQSARAKAQWGSGTIRQAHREAMADPVILARILAASKTPEARKKMSQSKLVAWSDPETRAKRLANTWGNPEYRAKQLATRQATALAKAKIKDLADKNII